MAANDPAAADIEGLIGLCRKDGRVCPVPKAWHRLWRLLQEKTQTNGRWSPSLPLILDGWHYSSDVEKANRVEEHLRWAVDHGALEEVGRFLAGQPDDQWHTASNRW